MEFGKLENISDVKWDLPPDDPLNQRWVRSANAESLIYLGAPAWGSKHWLGKIYPEHSGPEKFLFHYSRVFNSIELNTTHYRIPNEKNVKDWISQVPAHFKFCPKVHKDISHNRVGLLDKNLMGVWTSFLQDLSSHLGPCFIQFHESFSYVDKVMLFKFLENWPKEFKLAVELRHPSWFEKNKIIPGLAEYLHKKGMGLVITDVAGRRDVLHTTVPTYWTMIRLIGNSLVESDEQRLRDWARRLQSWQKTNIDTTYLFLHQPDDVWTIEFAQLTEKVFKQEGLHHVPSIEVIKNRDLFNLD